MESVTATRTAVERRRFGCLALAAGLFLANTGWAQQHDFPGRVRLVLPPTVYAVPDVEMNIYFDNVVLVANPANYIFDVTCEHGFQYDRRWSFTPAVDDHGDHPIVIRVLDEANAVVAQARSIVHVPDQRGRGTKAASLLAIGDSHLQRDHYLRHVLELSKLRKNFDLKLVGSRGTGNMPPTTDLRHEGYNGWTAQAFVTRSRPKPRTGYYVPSETGSPFMYEDEQAQPSIDFARYCQEFNGGQPLDFVLIQLGGNDVWRGSDASIDELIDGVLGYFDALIEMVHEFDEQTKVGVSLLDPPARSQHGFRNYRGPRKQTRWQYRRNQHRLVERLIARYGGRQKDNIHLIPVYVNLDCVNGFPMRAYPTNGRMPTKEQRVYDGAHLSPDGYRQFGDAVYAWIEAE